MADSKPYVDIRISGIANADGELNLTLGRYGRIEFPFELPDSGIVLEFTGALLLEKPEGVRSIVQAVLAGRGDEVRRLAGELGISESDFKEKGGGMFWTVVIVGGLCCASEAQ
jgi:hypothetical protein